VIIMRSLTVPVCAALGLLTAVLGMPLVSHAEEELPPYRVSPTEDVQKDSSSPLEEPEFELWFPQGQMPALKRNVVVEEQGSAFRSSRRTAWQNLLPQAQAEPALFSPDEDRPLKPLTGQWTENPIWQAEYIDTWGTHPATPVPSHTPRLRVGLAPQPSPGWGLRLNNVDGIVPVAGTETCPLKSCTTACTEKCGKCDPCKCENCPGKNCKGPANSTEPEHGETAKVILELMETLGRSVLDGTVFQKPDEAGQEWLRELSADGQVSPREALIQFIRHLEAQQAQAAERQEEEFEVDFASHPLVINGGACSCPLQGCSCPSEGHDCPAECAECRDFPSDGCASSGCADHPPSLAGCGGSEVEVLREMSSHLEMAANELERREIYHRADQLREVAGQLRQDARRTSLARKGRAPRSPSHGDVHAQLNELREELRRTRAELEQARGAFGPSRW
jgi:hypothetical protein